MNIYLSFSESILFQLDEQLNSSCIVLGDWPLSRVLLKNEQNYPWFILVPRKLQLEELYQLSPDEQALLMQEINHLSLLIKNHYQPNKINVATLGNMVRQLHFHCVARNEDDPLWPQGIWQGAYQASAYPEDELTTIIPRLVTLVELAKKLFI